MALNLPQEKSNHCYYLLLFIVIIVLLSYLRDTFGFRNKSVSCPLVKSPKGISPTQQLAGSKWRALKPRALDCQFSSVAQLCLTLCDPHELQHSSLPCPSPTPRACSNSCPSSWWCHPIIYPLLFPSPPAFNLSQHQGHFQWSVLHIRWAKFWRFSFSISPSNEYSGLISFSMD